ncbi:hypothetical protein GS531_23575 [Rhodococcus hoagii]|nr:hypothetical protein [Prescottella equi]
MQFKIDATPVGAQQAVSAAPRACRTRSMLPVRSRSGRLHGVSGFTNASAAAQTVTVSFLTW